MWVLDVQLLVLNHGPKLEHFSPNQNVEGTWILVAPAVLQAYQPHHNQDVLFFRWFITLEQ